MLRIMDTGKQVRLLRTQDIDVRITDDGKRFDGRIADPNRMFTLTLNGFDMPIDLAALYTLQASINTYLCFAGYDETSLMPIDRYFTQTQIRNIKA